MNTSEIKKLHELLKDLLEFLQKHRGQQNINYFTNTILDMMDICVKIQIRMNMLIYYAENITVCFFLERVFLIFM